jgi:cell division protein FtsN
MLFVCLVAFVVTACKSKQKVAENASATDKNTNGRPKVLTSSYYGFAQPTGRFSTSGGINGSSTAKAAEPTVKRVTIVEEDQSSPEESITTEVKKQVSKKTVAVNKPAVTKKPARKIYIDDEDSSSINEDVVPVVVKKRVKAKTENVEMADDNNAVVSGKFHVVVGSFSVKSNANLLLESIKAEGVKDAKLVVTDQGLYRVVIASYNAYQQAKSKAESVSNKYEDAWVLIQGKVSGKVKRSTMPRYESMGS